MYDGLDRLVSETLDSSDDAFDFRDTYAFDLASNRISLEKDANGDGANDVQTNYLYDGNDRLLVETKSTAAGDLISTTRYEYSPTEQVKKTVTDAAGNVIEQTEYTYNLQQRLADVAIDRDGDGSVDATAHYEYNADGIRVEKTDTENGETVTSSYLIDSRNPTGYAQVLEQIDRNANGDIIRAMAFTLGMDVIAQATQNAATGATQTLFFMYDAHGSTRGLLDANGAYAVNPDDGQVQAFTYSAYGSMLEIAPASVMTALQYSGEMTDRLTGMQNLRARFYDVSTGRFVRLDPFGGIGFQPGSLHKYAYVGGDPITNIDPSGEISLLDVLARTSLAVLVATPVLVGTSVFNKNNPLDPVDPASVGRLHRELALLSQDVYQSDPSVVRNWIPVQASSGSITGGFIDVMASLQGFHAQLYYNAHINTFALAFAGTDDALLRDFGTANIPQAIGGAYVSGQYRQALRLSRSVMSQLGASARVIFTGHSLGGGLASAAARHVDGEAVTFNSAGLQFADGGTVTTYSVEGEVLTAVQRSVPFLFPDASGNHFVLNPSEGDAASGMFGLHGIDVVIRALNP